MIACVALPNADGALLALGRAFSLGRALEGLRNQLTKAQRRSERHTGRAIKYLLTRTGEESIRGQMPATWQEIWSRRSGNSSWRHPPWGSLLMLSNQPQASFAERVTTGVLAVVIISCHIGAIVSVIHS